MNLPDPTLYSFNVGVYYGLLSTLESNFLFMLIYFNVSVGKGSCLSDGTETYSKFN